MLSWKSSGACWSDFGVDECSNDVRSRQSMSMHFVSSFTHNLKVAIPDAARCGLVQIQHSDAQREEHRVCSQRQNATGKSVFVHAHCLEEWKGWKIEPLERSWNVVSSVHSKSFDIIRDHDPSEDRSQVELPFAFKHSDRGHLLVVLLLCKREDVWLWIPKSLTSSECSSYLQN